MTASSSLQEQLALQPAHRGTTSGAWREAGIVVFVMLLLALFLLAATYIGHRITMNRRGRNNGAQRRRRRSRRAPATLAQTGGLPPKRQAHTTALEYADQPHHHP